MSQQTATTRRADYGIDAPKVLRRFILIGTAGIVVGLALLYPLGNVLPPGVASGFGHACLWMGSTFFVTVGVMAWGSKFGKARIANKLIGSLALKGDENVLDVGCGHGLMLITAARRLTTGRAVGVDIWQKEDQAGNSMEATLANVLAEGVSDRVELKDGDARQLPFEDNSFDLVVSSWALHNIYDKEERAKAVREITRVLKPGGRAALIDIQHTDEYAQIFRQGGMENVKRSGPNFVFVIPSHSLTATKSAR
jgi:SAM-dependent methyltransferase